MAPECLVTFSVQCIVLFSPSKLTLKFLYSAIYLIKSVKQKYGHESYLWTCLYIFLFKRQWISSYVSQAVTITKLLQFSQERYRYWYFFRTGYLRMKIVSKYNTSINKCHSWYTYILFWNWPLLYPPFCVYLCTKSVCVQCDQIYTT